MVGSVLYKLQAPTVFLPHARRVVVNPLLQGIRETYVDDITAAIQRLEEHLVLARDDEQQLSHAVLITTQTIREAKLTKAALEAIAKAELNTNQLDEDYKLVQGLIDTNERDLISQTESGERASLRCQELEEAISALKFYQAVQA